MSAWTGKPCQGCDGRKGPKFRDSKFCGNCKRDVSKASREAAAFARIERTYGMTRRQYEALYEFQGGRCYLCQRATGKYKRLAVDHDHSCCKSTPTCGNCNRGLVCGTDNKILGHARDNPDYFTRGFQYLMFPPFQQLAQLTSGGYDSHVVS